MNLHLTPVSGNAKTGPIPVTTTESRSCPPTCGMKEACFAKGGPLLMHWKAVDAGTRGGSWAETCGQIAKLPKGTLWRHNQAGDLPGVGNRIDKAKLAELVRANKGKRGFTYTHKKLTPANVAAIRKANADGFAINVSTDNLRALDRAPADLPRVTIVPKGSPKRKKSPGGVPLVYCPAQEVDDMTCARCGLCAVSDRKSAVVFRAHGFAHRKADKVAAS